MGVSRTRALWSEARAMAKQAKLLHHALVETHEPGTGPACVLVHGLYATAGVWEPLRQRLTRELSASTHSFSYVPGPGVAELAERLGRLLGRIDGARPVHLIGHSLGGLAVRYYVQKLSCDRRVVSTITLAAPFRGSPRHALVPGDAGRDIRPGASVLDELREPVDAVDRIAHLSIVALEDRLIAPDPYPSYGSRGAVPGVGHNGILFDERAIEMVVARVRTC